MNRSSPLDGSVTVMPGFVDFQAEHNPHMPCIVFPSREDSSKISTVTFQEYANATHRVAHALSPDGPVEPKEVVALLLHCDSLHYVALLFGAVRAGMIPFPMSPKNTPEAIISLLERTSCHRIISQPMFAALTSAVQIHLATKNFELDVQEIPAFDAVFPSLSVHLAEAVLRVEPYPTIEKADTPDEVVMYLHSSGSTGLPRPVPHTQKTLLHWCRTMPKLEPTPEQHVRWATMGLPTFHALGVFLQLLAPMVLSSAIGMYTPQYPAPPVTPNPHNWIEAAKNTDCTCLPTVPVILEAWVQSPVHIEYLRTLRLVFFAGGPLSDATGQKLATAGVKLFPFYGATEFGAPSLLLDYDDAQGLNANVRTSADWAWIRFVDMMKTRWVDQGDGTYELQILTTEGYQPCVENLTDRKGYATSDLFQPHPKKTGLWKFVSRTDDVVILNTGEKIVPIPQETHLSLIPLAGGAVIFGTGRSQVGVLLEQIPQYNFDPQDENALGEFRNKIWPHVEEANKYAPQFARIFKEMIIVTDPGKPMARAGKGTVLRKAVLTEYSNKIDELYKTVEASVNSNGIIPPKSWDVDGITVWLGQVIASIGDTKPISPSADLFEQGFDSLSATILRNRITGALRSSMNASLQVAASRIHPNFVYGNPSIHQLSVAIVNLIDPNFSCSAGLRTPTVEIEELIAKYSFGLTPSRNLKSTSVSSKEVVVLLTGSTGNLGCHILYSLLSDILITKAYTLDRSSPPAQPYERQRAAFESRGLDVALLKREEGKKLISLTGDLSQHDLGLTSSMLQEIKGSVTHVIHSAWKVDFNLSLGAFETQIGNTRRLIDISSEFTHNVNFFFTSSISVANGWDAIKHGEPVPEETLHNPEVTSGMGYGCSKYVVEKILSNASRAGTISTSSLRLGQICGSTTSGAWNPTDWVPVLLKSSVAMGCLPDLNGVVSWIPVDITAQTIVDFIHSSTKVPLPEVLNIVHPRPVPWRDLLDAFNDESGSNNPLRPCLPLIPYSLWLERLEKCSENGRREDMEKIPAIKMLSFFRNIGVRCEETATWSSTGTICEAGGFPVFESCKANKYSIVLSNSPRLDRQHVDLWVKYWRGNGIEL